MLWSALGGIGAVSTAIGLNGLSPWAPLGWFLLPVAAIVFGIYWNRGIYRYKYAWTLSRTTILPSPYRYDTECPVVDAKLYVTAGRFYHFAPRALPRFTATTDLAATLSPSTDFLVVASYTA